jgi:hypothetical protein
VDFGVLFVLADPRMLALNVAISKVCAAEVALVNNFVWNELWTFRGCGPGRARHSVRAGLAGGESGAGGLPGFQALSQRLELRRIGASGR